MYLDAFMLLLQCCCLHLLLCFHHSAVDVDVIHHPLIVDSLIADHHVQQRARRDLSLLHDLHLRDAGVDLGHVHHPGEAQEDLTANVSVIRAVTLHDKTILRNA